MKLKVLILIAGLSLVGTGLRAQERRLEPVGDTNFCESDRFKKIIEVIQCMEKNCDDPNGENKKLYEAYCNENGRLIRGGAVLVEATRKNAEPKINLDQKIDLTQKVNLDEKTPPVVAQPGDRNTVPLEPAEPAKILSPCDCLVALDNKFKEDGNDCHVELCPPPQQPEQPEPPKAVVPQAPAAEKKFLFEGSGCSLGGLAGSSDAGLWMALVTVASAFGFRRKK